MRGEWRHGPVRTGCRFALAFITAAAALAIAETASSDHAEKSNDPNAMTRQLRGRIPDTSVPAKAPEFSLEDQFGKSHIVSFPSEKESVIVLADKKGSKQVEGWIRLLHDKFNGRVDIHGIALLKGVPDALRSTVRYLFKRQVEYAVMLDWDGSVSERFAFKPDQACLFVVDREGAIVHSEYGSAEAERADQVVDALEKELRKSRKASH